MLRFSRPFFLFLRVPRFFSLPFLLRSVIHRSAYHSRFFFVFFCCFFPALQVIFLPIVPDRQMDGWTGGNRRSAGRTRASALRVRILPCRASSRRADGGCSQTLGGRTGRLDPLFRQRSSSNWTVPERGACVLRRLVDIRQEAAECPDGRTHPRGRSEEKVNAAGA